MQTGPQSPPLLGNKTFWNNFIQSVLREKMLTLTPRASSLLSHVAVKALNFGGVFPSVVQDNFIAVYCIYCNLIYSSIRKRSEEKSGRIYLQRLCLPTTVIPPSTKSCAPRRFPSLKFTLFCSHYRMILSLKFILELFWIYQLPYKLKTLFLCECCFCCFCMFLPWEGCIERISFLLWPYLL